MDVCKLFKRIGYFLFFWGFMAFVAFGFYTLHPGLGYLFIAGVIGLYALGTAYV